MKCPKCNGKLEVVDTRDDETGSVVRRRWCKKCCKTVYTLEKEIDPIDGRDLLNAFYNNYRRKIK